MDNYPKPPGDGSGNGSSCHVFFKHECMFGKLSESEYREKYCKNKEQEEDDDDEVYEIIKRDGYNFENIEVIGKLNGTFSIDDVEKESFKGEYESKYIANKDLTSIDRNNLEWNTKCPIPYSKGRVLYKTDIEGLNILDLVDIFIRYTHHPCHDLNLDESIANTTLMKSGTICPGRSSLFIYSGREFIVYGRYIFGQERNYVKISNDSMAFKFFNPPWDRDCEEYVYAFLIRNSNDNVLEAFGLFR